MAIEAARGRADKMVGAMADKEADWAVHGAADGAFSRVADAAVDEVAEGTVCSAGDVAVSGADDVAGGGADGQYVQLRTELLPGPPLVRPKGRRSTGCLLWGVRLSSVWAAVW